MSKLALIFLATALLGGLPQPPGRPAENTGKADVYTIPRPDGRGGSGSITADSGLESTERDPGERAGAAGDVRFAAVDVFIDAGARPLAAYQFELKVTAGNVTLVGVEGGEHRAFRPPPYYDPKALSQQRIIVAAFDTGSDLPQGRTRVARLMVQVRGAVAPAYDVTLDVAASADATAIPANISVSDTPVSKGAGR